MSHSAVIVIGSGSAGLDGRALRGAGEPRPGRLRGEGAGRSAHLDDRRRELPGLARRDRRARADGEDPGKQAKRFGADCRNEVRGRTSISVEAAVPGRHDSLDPIDPDAAKAEYTADALIVATGASARTLGIKPTRCSFMGNGLSTCATCDGALYRNKTVAVVGGGDTAVEEATFLTRYARQGHADPSPGRAPRLEDHAGSSPGKPQDRLRVERRDRRLSRRARALCRFLNGDAGSARRRTARRVTIPFDGVFLAIGHSPEHRDLPKASWP